MIAMLYIALAIATIVPLVFLYFLYAQDFYGTNSFGVVLLCFAWGLIAFGMAYGLANLVVWQTIFGVYVTNTMWVQFVAPIAEEIFKALILIYLVRRQNFTYFVDGAIYGFAAGIGFAVIENWSYVLNDPSLALGVAIGRVMSTNLVHGAASSLVGIALGYSRFQKFQGRVLMLLAGWLLGMTIHVGFNNLVSRVSSSLLLLYAAAVGFGALGIIVWMMFRGIGEQKKWIDETLGEKDRVTDSEVKVVGKLSDIEELLEPIAKQFGADKAKECEKFLFLQARIGIKRKILEKLSDNDEKMRTAVQAEIDEMNAEMNESRRKVGTYCMLYIRNIFPAETSPLWGRLENTIQERIAARPASAGPSLWSTLGDRAAQAAAPQGSDGESS